MTTPLSPCALGILAWLAFTASVAAQSPPATKPAAEPAYPLVVLAKSARDEEAVFNKWQKNSVKKFNFDYLDLPLKDIVADWAQMLDIPCEFDEERLNDVQITPKTPSYLSAKSVSVREAMRVVLREHGLSYEFRGGKLIVTTKEDTEAQEHLVPKYYVLGDVLMAYESADRERVDWDRVVQILRNFISPDSWPETGGWSGVEEIELGPDFPRALAISQTWEIHDRIERLLRGLSRVGREFRANPKEVTTKSIDFQGLEATRAVLETIDGREFDGRIQDLSSELTKFTGHKVLLDGPRLADPGITSDFRITGKYDKVPLRVGLQKLLDPHGLTVQLTPETIVITTKEEASKPSNLVQRIFPVYDLIPPGSKNAHRHLEQLANLVRPSGDFDQWQMETWQPPALIVQGSLQQVVEIEENLADLRRLRELRILPAVPPDSRP